MTTADTVTIEELLRNIQDIFEKVKTTKQPMIVVSRGKAQVAIISLDDFKKIHQS